MRVKSGSELRRRVPGSYAVWWHTLRGVDRVAVLSPVQRRVQQRELEVERLAGRRACSGAAVIARERRCQAGGSTVPAGHQSVEEQPAVSARTTRTTYFMGLMAAGQTSGAERCERTQSQRFKEVCRAWRPSGGPLRSRMSRIRDRDRERRSHRSSQ